MYGAPLAQPVPKQRAVIGAHSTMHAMPTMLINGPDSSTVRGDRKPRQMHVFGMTRKRVLVQSEVPLSRGRTCPA